MAETLSSEISPRTIGTAQWWQDRASAFEGLDKSLYLEEIIEELEGIEQRKYLRIQGSTDLSRSQFENWATEIGLVLNPPPGVEPFQHFSYELRKDQEENNPDYRPSGLEIVTAKDVGISEEEKKEYLADLVKWGEARREADEVINQELLAELVERRKARRDKDSSIDSPTVDLSQVHFDKTVGIALKHGVSPQLILIMRNAKQMLKKESCILPKVAEAAAAFCSRLARRAHLEAKVTEAPADTQQTEVDVGETTESGLPKPVLEGKRCAKVIDEVSRIKNFHASGGRTMNEIREEWPNYEVWRIVEQLPQEDQETFERPSMWGPKIGYARLILSKHYGNSTDTINDWVKAYKKHERSKNQKN